MEFMQTLYGLYMKDIVRLGVYYQPGQGQLVYKGRCITILVSKYSSL